MDPNPLSGLFVLVTFALCSVGNAMAWMTFAPIPSETALYYNITVNQVDMFSIIFMIIGIPVGVIAIYLVDKIGLKTTISISTWFNITGIIIRLSTLLFGGYNGESESEIYLTHPGNETIEWSPAPNWCYPIALLGTGITAVR